MDEDASSHARSAPRAAARRPRRAARRRGARAGPRRGRGARRDDRRARGDAARRGRRRDRRTGSARKCCPVARHLAEMRGLMNQVIRRLERVEGDLLAERHARVDDLALLVDLDRERLERRRRSASRGSRNGSQPASGAVVYRIEDRQGLRSCRLARAAARARSGCPRPGSLSSSIARRARARARSRSRGRAPCRRRRRDQNGRKIRSCSSARDPRPGVRQRRRRPRRSPPTSSSPMRPPSGVQRNAFASRFEMI